MNHKYRIWIFYAVLVLGLVGGSFLLGALREGVQPARAQDVLAPESPGGSPYQCALADIAVFETHIIVYCPPGDGGIDHFAYAVDSAHSSTANRMLATASSAFALGDQFWVFYDGDSSKNPPGCLVSNCRLMVGLVWKQ